MNDDSRDLLAAFNAAAAEYLLVRGYAVAFHAEPRFTKDLDVWVNPTPANAERVLAGRPQDLLDVELLTRHGADR